MSRGVTGRGRINNALGSAPELVRSIGVSTEPFSGLVPGSVLISLYGVFFQEYHEVFYLDRWTGSPI